MSGSSWWRRSTNYVSSHSNLFVVTGGVIGGVCLLSQYAISKFQQVQQKLVQDNNAKENLRRRFVQNQEDCTFTVLALLPTLGEQLFAKLNVEQLTEALRTPAKAPESPVTIETTTQPATSPSPQLNPLAKAFVPGASPKPAQSNGDLPPEEEPKPVVPDPIADAQEQKTRMIADRQAKLRLWNQLKTTAFARTLTSMYCVVLLTLQTHVQLNLIGRFAYLASVEAQAHELDAHNQQDTSSSSDQFGLDHETERLYLTFSWWFLHQGWDRLSDRVSAAVEKVLSPLSVKAQLSMSELKALLGDARAMIEHDLTTSTDAATPTISTWKRSNFLTILFPNTIEEEAEVLAGAGACSADDARLILRTNTKLRALLDETKDIIESKDFTTILSLCVDRVFDVLYNSLCPTFGIQQTGVLDESAVGGALQSRFQELTDEMQQGNKVKLASLFPVVTRQSQVAIHGVPNEFTENIAESKELRAFSAIIYAAWSPN